MSLLLREPCLERFQEEAGKLIRKLWMRNCVAGRVLGVLAWSPHHDASRGLIRLAFNIGPLSFSGKTGFHVLTPAQVFGLHENCEITCAESLARRESCSRVAALIEMGCFRVSGVRYKRYPSKNKHDT